MKRTIKMVYADETWKMEVDGRNIPMFIPRQLINTITISDAFGWFKMNHRGDWDGYTALAAEENKKAKTGWYRDRANCGSTKWYDGTCDEFTYEVTEGRRNGTWTLRVNGKTILQDTNAKQFSQTTLGDAAAWATK